MKNFSSLVNWVILLILLAVPGFLFYNWLNSKNTPQEAAIIQMKSSVEASKIFKQENEKKLSDSGNLNQSFTSSSTYTLENNSSTMNITNNNIDLQNTQKIAESMNLNSDTVKNNKNQEDLKVSVSTFSTVVSTMSYYAPISKRDPLLTPMDYARIKEEEERLKRAMEERKKEALRKQLEDSPLKKLILQGIVGQSAIINGEMVNVGQVFKGFKVIKIGPNYVIGIYKNKKYKLVLK